MGCYVVWNALLVLCGMRSVLVQMYDSSIYTSY